MPTGKGTYGSKVGRPPKTNKTKASMLRNKPPKAKPKKK